MLITSAPFWAAQTMPSMTSAIQPLPSASNALTGMIWAAGATPAMPLPLLARAAMIPATWVPWPLSSLAGEL